MLRFFDGNTQSNMGEKIGVDATLTFVPLRSFAGSESIDSFQYNLACHSRGGLLYYITDECGRPNCPSLWFMASLLVI